MLEKEIQYEIIVIDDYSTDKTYRLLTKLSYSYPLRVYSKTGIKGKAQSLLEGFKKARYDVICMIDADLQYPPEAIPQMFYKVHNGTDIVIANRLEAYTGFKRKIASKAFKFVFGKLLHGFDQDVQSGLKVFRREIIQRISLHPTPWGFDLEFLTSARNAGYTIGTTDIILNKRYSGEAKIGLFKAAYETGFAALKLRFANPEVILFHPDVQRQKGKGFHYKSAEFVPHTELHHTQTALYTTNAKQNLFFISFFLLLIFCFILNWHLALVVLIASLTFLYFTDLLFNVFLIFRSFVTSPEIQISRTDIKALDENSLPKYSIFCPLYKEWEVLPQFVTAMSRLDYPKDKLQIMLLLEEDDKEKIGRASCRERV